MPNAVSRDELPMSDLVVRILYTFGSHEYSKENLKTRKRLRIVAADCSGRRQERLEATRQTSNSPRVNQSLMLIINASARALRPGSGAFPEFSAWLFSPSRIRGGAIMDPIHSTSDRLSLSTTQRENYKKKK
jgi:hypothetical protein